MKKLVLILTLLVSTSFIFAQTKIWEKSDVAANYPSFLGTGSTERGFATGTIELKPYSRIWEKSVAMGNYPTYFHASNSTERGFAYGNVNGNDRIYVVSRNGGTNIFVLDAATGDSLGKLDMTGIAGGTFLLNDVEVSSDGVIFACNLTTNTTTSAFRVYKWTSESATPVEVVTYTGLAFRFGDKFTVTGSTADNSVAIWAAGVNSDKVVKFTTSDNASTFTPSEITLSSGNVGNTPAVYPNNDGSKIFVNAAGMLVTEFDANGTFVDTVAGSIVGTGSDALRYFELNSKKYLAIYNYGIGNENLRIVDITNGLSNASLVAVTPSLGSVSNGNGTGDVGLKFNNDNTVNLYVMGTNNGMAGFKVDPANVGSIDRMYVVSRKGGTNIIMLDAATGDSLGTLDMTGVSGGTFLLNDAEVSADGAIYACNLTLNSTTSPFKIYRWANESSSPEEVVSYNGLAFRFGDKFTVTGMASDNSLTIYAATAGSDKIVKFTTSDNGSTFTPNEITLSDGSMSNTPAVYPNMDGSELYVNSAGAPLKRYHSDGTAIDTLSTSVVSTGSDALRYFELASKKYVATYNYGTGNENLRVVDVTNGLANGSLVITTPSLGSVSNGNGTGDVSVKDNKDGSENLYILATNNGLAAYNFTPPTQVAAPKFVPAAGTYYDSVWVKLTSNENGAKIYYTLDGSNPTDLSTLFADSLKVTDTTKIKAIAYATGMLPSDVDSATYDIAKPINIATIADLRTASQGGIYRLTGEAVLTFQQSFRNQKFIQDATGGILLDDNGGAITTTYNVGDGISNIIGSLTEFGNMMEFIPLADPGMATSTGNKITPMEITLSDFKANEDMYESRLVMIKNLSFVDADGIVKFANGQTYPVTDGTDTVQFRTTFYDVNYIGTVIPMGKINVTGIPNSRSTGDYVTARDLGDLGIVIPAAKPLFPLWGKTQAGGNFPNYFSTGNYERGMAYGKVNGKDRVYVLARTGGPKIFVFDAMTGDSVGVIMPTATVSGGTFPLTFVDVSDDGIIFADNLTIDASSSAFKVYRWDSEQDTPKVVIDYTDAGLTGARLGDVFSVFGKASDNSLVIYAAASGKDKIVKFTTSDNGMSFTPTIITLSNGNMGSDPNVALAKDGSLYIKSYGKMLYHYQSDGTLMDSVSSSVIGTDVTDIKYASRENKDYILCYHPNDGMPYTDERLTVADVTNPLSANVIFHSPSIGDKPNLNATGAVDFMTVGDNDVVFFLLGTNNGLAAFSTNPGMVISNLDSLFYGNTPTLLPNPYGAGFIAGTNSYGDLGKYERFDFKKGDKLSGFKFYFGYKKIVGDPDTLSLVVKTVGTNGAPDSTIAKLPAMTGMLDTTGMGNIFILNSPITLDGPVFIGFEFSSTANDTIAITTDKDGEGDKADRAWEKFSDGNYNDFGTQLNSSYSWGIDVDLWIKAYYKKGIIVNVESQGTKIPQQYSLDQNYPNPFNPTTTIRFSLKVSANVGLKIYNILGQQVATLLNKDMRPGVHAVNFNASALASGVYFYRLEVKGADGSQFSSVKKLMLLK